MTWEDLQPEDKASVLAAVNDMGHIHVGTLSRSARDYLRSSAYWMPGGFRDSRMAKRDIGFGRCFFWIGTRQQFDVFRGAE